MQRHKQHKVIANMSQPIFSFAPNPYNTSAPFSKTIEEYNLDHDKPLEIQRIEKNMKEDRQKILNITEPIAETLVSVAPFFGPAAATAATLGYGAYNYFK
jgi:hypothetical protein